MMYSHFGLSRFPQSKIRNSIDSGVTNNRNQRELPKSSKKFTEITTKRTEISGTSCRYMFPEFKNVTFITASNIRVISLNKMWKNTKKPEVAILILLDADL